MTGTLSFNLPNTKSIVFNHTVGEWLDYNGNFHFGEASEGWGIKSSAENTLFYVNSSGNVGVGTINPTYKFELSGGNAFITGHVKAGQGYYLNSPGTGTYDISALYSTTDGLILESPRSTDSNSSNALPIMFRTRGSQYTHTKAMYYYFSNSYTGVDPIGYIGSGSDKNSNIQLCTYDSNPIQIGTNSEDNLIIDGCGYIRCLTNYADRNTSYSDRFPIFKSLAYSPSPYGLVGRVSNNGTYSLQVQREANDTETFPLWLQSIGGVVNVGNGSNSIINLLGPGADTYTLGQIYCNSNGFTIECPRVSNSYTAASLSTHFKVRGGQYDWTQARGHVFMKYDDSAKDGYIGVGAGNSNTLYWLAYGPELMVIGSNSAHNPGAINITGANNVGIGDANPAYKLEVRGDTRIATSLYVGRTSSDGTTSGRVYLGEWIQFAGQTGLYWPNNNGGYLYPANTTYGSIAILGSRGGYNGINFGNTDGGLTIMESGEHRGFYDTSSGWSFYHQKSTNKIGIGTSGLSGYTITIRGTVYTASNMYAASFYENSDIRLKTNILDLIPRNADKIRLVEFNWKESGEKGYGVIAQEIEQYYPSIVHTDNDGYKKVNYDQIAMIKIKYLEDQIKELKEIIQELGK